MSPRETPVLKAINFLVPGAKDAELVASGIGAAQQVAVPGLLLTALAFFESGFDYRKRSAEYETVGLFQLSQSHLERVVSKDLEYHLENPFHNALVAALALGRHVRESRRDEVEGLRRFVSELARPHEDTFPVKVCNLWIELEARFGMGGFR